MSSKTHADLVGDDVEGLITCMFRRHARVRRLLPPRKSVPKKPPHLVEIILLIAHRGAYVSRRQHPPGPQTDRLGLQLMKDLSWAWETSGPDAQ